MLINHNYGSLFFEMKHDILEMDLFIYFAYFLDIYTLIDIKYCVYNLKIMQLFQNY